MTHFMPSTTAAWARWAALSPSDCGGVGGCSGAFAPAPMPAPIVSPDCGLCPRLAQYRAENKVQYPDFFNAPVPSFGDSAGEVLIVGLAPGVKGANRTGRPFTGDFAGELLYQTLLKYGFAKGTFKADPKDGLMLVNCRLTNAVRCVPPQNKPVGEEINQCRPFLRGEIDAMPRLRAILCLGKISHDSTLRALGARLAAHPFAHNVRHDVTLAPIKGVGKPLGGPNGRKVAVFNSYHCSRYNTNTGRLTEKMFEDVFESVTAFLA